MQYELGLIGYPVDQSLSPWLHRRFLELADLYGEYSLIEVTSERLLESTLQQIKRDNYKGFNVTVPYKKAVIPYLDETDNYAEMIGAVNTVVNNQGKLIGYNTDGKGYVTSLKRHYPGIFQAETCRILLIGAGGAAQGIFYALDKAGFTHIDIANRTLSSAENIARLKEEDTRTTVLSLEEAEESLGDYDLIIQTTNIGMEPKDNECIIALENIKKYTIVSDIVYKPIETTFLKEAKRQGALILYGHTMLLYQAKYAFELWTNEQIEVDHIDQELKNVLEG